MYAVFRGREITGGLTESCVCVFYIPEQENSQSVQGELEMW